MAGSSGTRSLTWVALVVLVVAVAGGVNYWRNYQAEIQQAGDRPYQGYADEELAALIEAYRSEADTLRGRHDQVARQRVGGVAREAHISDHLEGFDRASRHGQAVRKSAGEAAQALAVLHELEREQGLRADTGEALEVHIRRLTTL